MDAAPAAVTPAYPAVLTIAGSDSGGGAGIQADLKTFAAFDVFGASAITCVTAQNPDAVTGVAALDPDMVRRQIRAVFDGFPVAAIKTGMLYQAEIIVAVADELAAHPRAPLVVDPVMIATSGGRLLRPDAIAALGERVLPLATVMTPNLPEAEALWGRGITTRDDLIAAARALAARYGTACVVKGGHLEAGAQVADVLCEGGEIRIFETPRIAARETHGTGCTFSAALAAGLARGRTLAVAVADAQRFVARALARSRPVGRHSPLALAPLD